MAIETGTGNNTGRLRALTSALLERFSWMRQAGITFNGKRDLYETLGYDRIITSRQYRDRYARGGIAGKIVDAIPMATWRGDMWLEEDEDPKTNTAFEQAWEDLEERLKIKAVLQQVDILSRLGSYAVLLIGAPGDLETELPRGNPDSLLYMTPFAGGGGPSTGIGGSRQVGDIDADATIMAFETDSTNPRFGLPTFYQLRRLDVVDPSLHRPIHWSRILHIAEGCLDSRVYGTPALERCWNDLDNLEKVVGGGSESFWLRANQGMHLNLDKDVTDLSPTTQAKMNDEVDEYQHNIRRILRTRGMDVKMLGSDVANFQSPADAVLTLIAGATGIPKRILVGSEMGELASTQDRSNFRDIVNGRQTGYAGPYIVRPLADRLIEYGYLPKPKSYDVKWPHIEVLTDPEKAEGAGKWAMVNSTAGVTVFTAEEIRDHWYGMEPAEEADTEQWKAAGAEKMATVNKTQGAMVFPVDEIRKTWYGWPPLTPEQDIPMTAPERVSSNAPTPEGDKVAGKGIAAKPAKAGPQLVAAQHELSSTQIQLPDYVAQLLAQFPIDDADLAAKGRETDAHVTVKYGLVSPDPAPVQAVLAGQGSVRVTFGKTGTWPGDGFDVVFVPIVSDDLARLNSLLTEALDVIDMFPYYQPHATIAYVKSGTGIKYVGSSFMDGLSVTVNELVFSPPDDQTTTVSLAPRVLEEDHELVKVLEAAIVANNTEVIDAILGVDRALGGPGSGNHGHGGRKGEVGGSSGCRSSSCQ